MTLLTPTVTTGEMTDYLVQHGILSSTVSPTDDVESFNKHFEEIDKQASRLGFQYDAESNTYTSKSNTYVVCKTPKCQQTYPVEQFTKGTEEPPVNVKCPKCGGSVIGKKGEVQLSQQPWVIPGISVEELEKQHKSELKKKRQALAELEKDVKELEAEGECLGEGWNDTDESDITNEPREDKMNEPEKAHYLYACESGCGHTTIIDKFYKTKRVFCGVCGTKSTMVYQGECTVNVKPKPSIIAPKNQKKRSDTNHE